MKFKLTKGCFLYRKRLLLIIMRTFIFLCCATVFALTPNSLVSQHSKVKIATDESLTVDEVFDLIMDQTEYRFFYEEGIFRDYPKVQVQKGRINTNTLLKQSLAYGNLSIEVTSNNTILISEKSANGKRLGQQDKVIQFNISGTVTDEDNTPLPGVNILIMGTNVGVVTDFDGFFSINADKGDQLLVSYLGMETQKITVGEVRVIKIIMKESENSLNEVVVTALGIKKEKKALGYATQEVSAEKLAVAPSVDIASNLSGKVAGLQINTSATIGGSSRIVLRGENSLSRGGNDALIVVDGVPINSQSSVAGGVDWGNGLSDLNSNDIESVNVLKGASAAALYGSRAGNGVILITTKKGNVDKPFSVDYNNSTMFESLLSYPDTYQYEFAVGRGEGRGLYTGRGVYNPAPYDESWSSEKYDPNKYIEWWYSPTSNGFRAGDLDIPNKGRVQKLPFISSGRNNYEEFFTTGHALFNNIAVSSVGEKTNARFSFENMNQKGMQPGTDLKRNSLSTNISSQLGDQLKLNFVINYVNTKSDNRPRQHWGPNSINYVLTWMMPGVRMDQLRDYWQPGLEGLSQIRWRTGHNNPYFLAHEVKAGQNKNRMFGNINLTYDITKDLSLFVRHGDDLIFEKRTEIFPFGLASGDPSYNENRMDTRESNSDFLLSYNGARDRDFQYDLSAGGNLRNVTYEQLSAGSSKLLVPGIYSLNNSAVPNWTSEFDSKKRVYSIYAFANLSYRNWAYLNLTARNDWSSTLPRENNSYFYPSATLSLLLSEAMQLPGAINYLKLRTGYSQVGKDTSPYALQNTISNDGQYEGYVGFDLPSSLANPDLKPEIATEMEFGLETKLFGGRIGLDITYYEQETVNQVIPITLPYSSGYNSRMTNVGKITNNGIEMMLNGKIVDTGDFTWTTNINYSKNKNKVVALSEGLEQYSLGGFGDNGEELIARIGGPLFSIYGYKQTQVDDPNSQYFGEYVYSPNGAPHRKDELEYLGNANPDYQIGFSNSFNYKNISLDFLVDLKQGGIAYSAATNIMYGGGYNQETANWRNNGVGGEGVILNTNGSYTENNIVLSGNDIKNVWVSPWRKISTNNFYDASYVKLREFSLAYTFSKQILEKVPFDRVKIALVGRNLFIWDKMPNQDPDVYFEGIPGYTGGYTYPTSRTYGMSLNISF
ncbi:SusC/RagA family TonB-linked outer membrane protein [Arenibacter sp. S6351L]|uniref:SusC/RagA family TonB-linked outer membrane protein n=1 Tax=Arenibacter sp. S6351L TaxID=2926407 RepID=UPI001FF20AA5|nr:SusC/RagA family TonB-linked outer membrane protein [Arenibacter sp. S6351L]MCK0135998.1 SusC/RagA family TonB-linked outer membrane protein [Arenibacter sp. S6351L]